MIRVQSIRYNVGPLSIIQTIDAMIQLTIEDIEKLDRGERVEEENGNYFYKDKYNDDDYRFYFVSDPDTGEWDEERYTREELIEYFT